MAQSLKELRAQRALIQQHLNWLDQQIAQADGDTSGTAETSGGTTTPLAAKPEPAKRADAPIATPTLETAKLKASDAAPTESPSTPVIETEEKATPLDYLGVSGPQAPAQSDIAKAKIGCFVVFIGGTLLFLFLLFGLPYFLD